MKTFKTFLILVAATALVSCSKDSNPQPQPEVLSIPVPNGSFENWTNNLPDDWETNSCPACVPPYEMYIVRQDTDAYAGQFAAKFICNNVFAAVAENGFAVTTRPDTLTAYVKCNLAANDSVRISVTLFSNNTAVDNGQWFGTASIPAYTQIQIPITQNSALADSVAILIEGGNVSAFPLSNTELWIDEVELE